MADNLLFVVHGMGVHTPDTWADEVRDKLNEVAGRYPAFQNASLWDNVELVPVNYDDHLSQALDQWQNAAGPVSTFAEQQKLPGSGSLDWLDDVAATADNFFWSHAADVVIYRFFRLYRERIRASVVRQIVEKIETLPGNDRFGRCTVLSHSLGTSVAHDALHLLATVPFGGRANPFSPPMERFRAIFTLANVSRVVQSDIKAYDSVVRPGPRNGKTSNCSRFYNYRHVVDPICVPWRFDPVDFAESLFIKDELRHYRDWNVHGFAHYLDHPRVHIPLINTLLGRSVITRSQRIAAVSAESYPQFGGRLEGVAVAKTKIDQLVDLWKDLKEDSGWKEMLQTLTEAGKVVEELKQAVDGLGN